MAGMDINADDLIKYLVAKGAKPECPSCGENDWHMSTGAQEFATLPIAKSEFYARTTESYLAVMTMICKNCGFVRMHARPLVEAWKKDQKR
jgi:hypothetical protein